MPLRINTIAAPVLRRSVRPAALPVRIQLISSSPRRLDIPSWPGPPVPQPPVGPSDDLSSPTRTSQDGKKEHESFWHQWLHSPSFQAALTTMVGLGMVFGAGVGYLEWYKSHVLHRVSHHSFR
jgi:hypothetical protein